VRETANSLSPIRTNLHTNCLSILVRLQPQPCRTFWSKFQILSFLKIHPLGAAVFCAKGQTDRQTKGQKLCNHVANSRFSLGELFRKPIAVAWVPPRYIAVAIERESSSPSTQNTASVYCCQQFYSLRLYITSFEETNLTCQRRR
jgi:hypothetical protein